MNAHPSRIGIVWLGEDVGDEPGEIGIVYSGRFSGYHDTGVEASDHPGIEDVTLAEGLRWARERADDVRVRIGDELFSAGTAAIEGLAVLADGLVVERRRPVSEEWRDRTDADEPIGWQVEVDLTPPRHAPGAPEWDAVVAEIANRVAGVTRTSRGTCCSRAATSGRRPRSGRVTTRGTG